MNERFLELTGLGKTYVTPNGPAVIVKDFDLHVHEGEFVCVIGHSGCGKSTVLSIVMGLNDATEGGVILAGREVAGPGTDRGVVFHPRRCSPGSRRAATCSWRWSRSTVDTAARNGASWRTVILRWWGWRR